MKKLNLIYLYDFLYDFIINFTFYRNNVSNYV